MQDFVTRKQRLSKKDYSADFILADSDDFYGFSQAETQQYSLLEVIIAIIGVIALYGVSIILLSF